MYDNINMPMDGIEWDDKKARLNIKTHGISFETAQYVFSDPERLELIGVKKTHLMKKDGKLWEW